MRNKEITTWPGALFSLYLIVCWIVNTVQLFKCDFEAPFKEEIIKLLGVFIMPLSGITVWF